MQKTPIVFFGTPALAEVVLDELERAGLAPDLVVTAPDKPAGRGMQLKQPPAKIWADAHGVPTLQPEKIDDEFLTELRRRLPAVNAGGDHTPHAALDTLFIVFAYGKILPQALLDIPLHGTINLHPSLLPKLRGPSPMRSAILNDEKETGVSVMLIDAQMDHGPILAQEKVVFEEWPHAREVEARLMNAGAQLLAATVPTYLAGEIVPQEQDDSQATYCSLFKKEDALLDLSGDPYQNFLKIRAYEGWPNAYFMHNGKHIKITEATFANGTLTIEKVVPEGGKEMDYASLQ